MEEEKVYTLTVRGKENYDLLCAMRDQLELASDLLREKNQASLQKMRLQHYVARVTLIHAGSGGVVDVITDRTSSRGPSQG